MSKLVHPDMNRGGNNPPSQKQNKVYVVDDLSEPGAVNDKILEYEGKTQNENVVEKQNQSVANDVVNNVGSKKLLEKLIFIGRNSSTFSFCDHEFEISTLSNKESNDVIRKLVNIGNGDIFVARIYTLAYAIRKIDNILFDDVEVDSDFDNSFDKKVYVLDNMQLSLIEKLYEKYESLVKDTEKSVYGENIKN